jgi:uncharacterized protein YjdB
VLPTVTGNANPVVRVKAAQTTARLVKGKSLRIPVKAFTATGAAATLTFSSSNARVATVSKTGLIKAKKVGTARITAKSANGPSTVITVKVVAAKSSVKLTRLKLSGIPKSLKIGQVVWSKVSWSPSKRTGVKVTYRSSRSSVLTVDATGRVAAVHKGTAKLTVKAGGKAKSLTVTVR